MSALLPDVSTSFDYWLLDFEIVWNFHCWNFQLWDVPLHSWGNTNLCCHCTREAGFFLGCARVASPFSFMPRRVKVFHARIKNGILWNSVTAFLPQYVCFGSFGKHHKAGGDPTGYLTFQWRMLGDSREVPKTSETTTARPPVPRFTKIAACFSSRSINKRSCCFFLTKWLSLQDQGAPSVRVAQIIVREFEGIGKNHSIQIPGGTRLHGSGFLLAVQVMFWNYPTSLGCEHTPIELQDCQWLSYIQRILEWEKFKLDQFWQWWPMSSWVAEATPRAAGPPSWPLGVDNEITSDA